MIKVLECIEWKAPNRPGEMSRFVEHFKKSDPEFGKRVAAGLKL